MLNQTDNYQLLEDSPEVQVVPKSLKHIETLITRGRKSKKIQCPGDAISIVVMLVSGVFSYLSSFHKNIDKMSHSDKINEWNHRILPNNATCKNTLGDITDSGSVIPFISYISQNSTALLQSCEELKDSISNLSTTSTIFQGAMIVSLTMLAIAILNRVAAIISRTQTYRPIEQEREEFLMKKKIELVNSLLNEHVTSGDVIEIILEYAHIKSLKSSIEEKFSKASTKSAKRLRATTEFITKLSTPKMALIHTASVGALFTFLKLSIDIYKKMRMSTKAQGTWADSLIPYDNNTCSDLYGECTMSTFQTVEQPCEKICEFISGIDSTVSGASLWIALYAGSALIMSVTLAFLCVELQSICQKDPIQLDSILTGSELSFLREIGIRDRHLTDSLRARVSELTESGYNTPHVNQGLP